ncbi:Rcs stress response system protein RcsF [Pseudidiomarina salilacus]|uniref:Rcs stress response system protein RcsF n=1 Tax=Pseudidiomarina salilacus TaxID=3384452 RepID=UPI003984A595
MNKLKISILTALLGCTALLSGCTSTPEGFSAEQLAQADQVRFVKPYELTRTDVRYNAVGEVSGESCSSQVSGGPASHNAALLQLKLAAAQRQADTVVLQGCQQTAGAGCDERWLCTGAAYQQINQN